MKALLWNYYQDEYTNKADVEEQLKRVQEEKKCIERQIRDYFIITEPARFTPKDEDPLQYLAHECERLMREYGELVIDEYKLMTLADQWREMFHKNGGAKNPIGAEPRIHSGYVLYTDENGEMTFPEDELQQHIAKNMKIL